MSPGLVDLNAACPCPARMAAARPRRRSRPDRAAALAAAIVDFRDEDDVPDVNGAESAAYRAAGLAHGPKNTPRSRGCRNSTKVLGMDVALLGRLRAVTTAHSRQPGIDSAVAPREILAVAAAGAAGRGLRRRPIPASPRVRTSRPHFRIPSRG